MNKLSNEMIRHIEETIRHACHVEYFLENLHLGQDDPQRPHDLVGPGNKLEWEVAKGMSLVYANPQPDFHNFILPSIEIHRKRQHHHQMWNLPNPENRNLPNHKATINDLLVGAVDAVCSMIESRVYAGGKDHHEELGKPFSWEEIEADGYAKFDPHKRPYAAVVIQHMKRIPPLDVKNITMRYGRLSIPVDPEFDLYASDGLSKEWYTNMERTIKKGVARLEREERRHSKTFYRVRACPRGEYGELD